MDKTRLMDISVRPGDDFFRYATGRFAEEYEQPSDRPSWTFFDVLEENVIIGQLREIIDNLNTDNPLQKKIADVLSVSRNPHNGDPETLDLLDPYIEKLRSFEDRDALLEYAVKELYTELPLSVCISPDMRDSSRYEIYLWQNLLLYNKKYYEGAETEVYDKYREVASSVLLMMGYDKWRVDALINSYFDFEKQLLDVAYSVEDMNKPELNYTMMGIDDASAELGYDLKRFLSYGAYDDTYRLVVSQPAYAKKFFDLLSSVSLDTLKDVIEFSFAMSCTECFSDEISDEMWKFNQFKSGAKERQPKWKREITEICSMFTDPIGKIYSEKYFGRDSKEAATDMVTLLKESFAEIIESQEWMSPKTKKIALDKLAAIKYDKIGFPEKWDLDYNNLEVDTTKTAFENSFAVNRFLHQRHIRKYYNKDVDPEEWPMAPYTINACFSQVFPIEICFPAGILQPPFFDPKEDMAGNLGSIGVIIGHEMTHGFDRNGRMFDKYGNMENWWTPEDEEHFITHMVNPMITHFSEKQIIPFVKCNGELEVSENIADNGGLRIALNALERYMENNGIVGEKRLEQLRKFFMSYATNWCCVQTEEIMKNNNMNNEHAAPVLRVNAQVQLFDEWYKAFDVKEGDKLWLPAEKRIWTW